MPTLRVEKKYTIIKKKKKKKKFPGLKLITIIF